VEFAMVSPFVFLFFFASLEFGRLQMAYHGLEGAAREGCRTAMSWKASSADVEQTVTNRLRSFGIAGQSLTILPSPLSGAREWEPITVRVEVPYSQVSWLPIPRFLQGITLVGSCILPKEAVDPGS
jgi:Flp pilus assembly protein TadG